MCPVSTGGGGGRRLCASCCAGRAAEVPRAARGGRRRRAAARRCPPRPRRAQRFPRARCGRRARTSSSCARRRGNAARRAPARSRLRGRRAPPSAASARAPRDQPAEKQSSEVATEAARLAGLPPSPSAVAPTLGPTVGGGGWPSLSTKPSARSTHDTPGARRGAAPAC
jgi:hypothetical protein